jgi:6-pyruvoyltetrahydropterin/6-carboxytetrahydropterin synthase
MSNLSNHTIRVTKQFTFDMAHALYGYDGACKNIHGHTYVLNITLRGKVLNESGHPKDGMVIDFTEFKRIVKERIVDVFDHALVLNGISPHADLNEIKKNFEKVLFVNFQPSCENLVLDFLDKIIAALPNGISVNSIKLLETPTSYAEWFAEDNETKFSS